MEDSIKKPANPDKGGPEREKSAENPTALAPERLQGVTIHEVN
jgi:hypothetical protein